MVVPRESIRALQRTQPEAFSGFLEGLHMHNVTLALMHVVVDTGPDSETLRQLCDQWVEICTTFRTREFSRNLLAAD